MPLDTDFIILFFLLLSPPVVIQIFYMAHVEAITGKVIQAPDFDIIYYQNQSYAPLTAFLAHIFDWAGGRVGLMLMAVLLTLILPSMLIAHITKNLIHAGVYVYATIIPTFYLISATFPQAIVVILMLSTVAWPKYWPVWIALAFLAHTFGLFGIILAYGVSIWRKTPEI